MLTAEQHAQRRGKITASIAPDIIGVSPYRGAIAAWLRITGRHTEDESEQAADDPRRWGHHVERELLRWYSETRKVEIAYFGSIEHPTLPWLLATPDAAVFGERGLVECKNVGARMAHHWPEDGAPTYVIVQNLVQLAVAEADWVDVVASIGGNPPRVVRIRREDYVEEMNGVIEMLAAFHRDHIVTDDPPPPDEATSARDVQGVFPKHTERLATIEGDEDLITLVKRYREASATESEAKEEKERAKAQICARIGDAKGIEVVDGDLRWRATWAMRDAAEIPAYTRAAYRHFDVREVKAKRSGKQAA